MSSAEQRLQEMTLKQKLGQMICIRAGGYDSEVLEGLKRGEVGSIGSVFFKRSLTGLESVVGKVNEYMEAAAAPLLLFSDGEQGMKRHLGVGTTFPSMMALGATFSTELAYRMGWAIGREARAVGFGMISNPVLDINSNPDNPIINTRAMSDRAELIIELGEAYIRGMQDAQVIPNGKHYPGHGDTHVDSHVSMPKVDHSLDHLLNTELRPFRELIAKGMMGIMTAHILYPALMEEGEEPVPATLSRTIITKLLRERLGFQGLIVSDSLTMKSVKLAYGIERAAVLAVQAGNDIILQDYQSDPAITYRALLQAVESGQLSAEHIDESVLRILRVKEQFGLLDNPKIDLEEARAVLTSEEHRAIAREIADRSVTVLEGDTVPLPQQLRGSVLVVATRSADEGREVEDMGVRIESKADYLLERCSSYCGQTDLCIVGEEPDEADFDRVSAMLRERHYDHVVFGTFVRVVSYKEGSGTISPGQSELIRRIREMDPGMSVLIFGSPYILRKTEGRFANCICVYNDSSYSIDSAVRVLFGELQAAGKLPVDVNETYVYGYGL